LLLDKASTEGIGETGRIYKNVMWQNGYLWGRRPPCHCIVLYINSKEPPLYNEDKYYDRKYNA
jgi:hypothetical protein